MQLSHSARAVFDEANLVSCAGLVPALSLAERAGWSEHLEALSVSLSRVKISGRTVESVLKENLSYG
jgi:hypothetical protein